MGFPRSWVVLATLLVPAGAYANDHNFEMFAAPSFLNATGSTIELGGWHLSGAATLGPKLRHVSVVADLSTHFIGSDDAGEDVTQVTFAAGPRVNLLRHNHSQMPFVQVLFLGAVHRTRGGAGVAASAGAVALGAGWDYAPGERHHWASRVQVDFIKPLSSDLGRAIRVSAGVVYRFGASSDVGNASPRK